MLSLLVLKNSTLSGHFLKPFREHAAPIIYYSEIFSFFILKIFLKKKPKTLGLLKTTTFIKTS